MIARYEAWINRHLMALALIYAAIMLPFTFLVDYDSWAQWSGRAAAVTYLLLAWIERRRR